MIRIPSVLGWLRPVILLPATALTGLTPEQWQAILAHELAHVRRNDYLVNLAQTVVETLLFYHPAVWCLSGRIRAEREHCCDDLAVAACGDAAAYMRALAELEQLRGAPEPALGAGGGSLVKRVRRLTGAAHTRPSHLPAWLAGAVALVVVAAVVIGVQACGIASRPSKYDHFLFVRTDNIEGQPGGTDTLVMAKVTPEGFELRDFHSKNNLGVGLEYLGVFGGQAYLMKIDQLYRLDLATGKFAELTERTQEHDYVDGRLFTLEGGNRIREYDLRAGAYREVATVADPGHGRLKASPDGKRLAFFRQAGIADQLNVVDVARGTVSQVGERLRFFPQAASSGPNTGPPFVWLNDQEILLARTEGQGRRDASGQEFYRDGDLVDHLAVISVETGEARDVTAIPGQPSVHRVEIETPNLVSLPVLLLSDAGVGRARYLVDPRAGKLVESEGIGGDFHLRVTASPDGEMYHQLWHGTKLLVAEKGYTSARVSPDAKRVIWAGDWPLKLNYYDSEVGRVRPVAQIWSLDGQESLLWVSGEDLKAASPTRPAAGWREMREPAEPDQAGSTKAGQSGPGKPPAAPPEALRRDWGPKRVSQRLAGTAQAVHRFVSRMSYSSGRDPEAERELLAQGKTRAQADLRGLLGELPSSDRFRFMVAFTMYWMGFDYESSRAVMLEYCPPGNKPGYEEDTIIFLDYAYRKRPDHRLLEGILEWVPRADGAGAEALASILPDKARSHPRDLLSALKSKPSLLWSRAANLLFVSAEKSPERAYPALVTIAGRREDPQNGLARRLLREMASTWPSPSQWPPAPAPAAGIPAAAGLPFYDLALLTPPLEVRGEWYVPARQFREWLRASMTVPDDMSSLTLTWRGKSRTWTRRSGRLVFHAGTAFIPIQDIGQAFGERVSLRADGRVIDFGTPGEGRVYAAIPVGWRNPVRPKGLSPDEMEIWWRLLRPDTRSAGNVKWEPYDIRVVGRWAAAKIHPLNGVTDDALVLLDGRWGAWRVIALGTDLPAGGRNYGIPAEAREQLGLPF